MTAWATASFGNSCATCFGSSTVFLCVHGDPGKAARAHPYGWKPGAAHGWYGERNKKTVIDEEPKTRELDKHSLVTEIKELRNGLCGTVIREDKPPNACQAHPTMKPVDLIVSMLRNSSTRGDIVLDIYGGSGSALIACEKPGRHARVMELDQHHCDVIIRRGEKFSGQEALLEGDGQTFGQIENG